MNICVWIVFIIGPFAFLGLLKWITGDSWRALLTALVVTASIVGFIALFVYAAMVFIAECPLC